MIVLEPTGLVAILRGVTPHEAEAIGAVLVEAGFGAIEVPLNSPDPFASIAALTRRYGERTLIGGGTVLAPSDVERVGLAGGRLIVAPNLNGDVIEQSVKHGLAIVPGVATPTEAFRALDYGASALKMFPAEASPPEVTKAWLSVLPEETQIFPVGGITPERIAPYRKAGAAGFGIGGALFKPGMTPAQVAEKAKAFVAAWQGASR